MQQKFKPYYDKLLKEVGELLGHFDLKQGEHDFLFERKINEITQNLTFGEDAEYRRFLSIGASIKIYHSEIDSIKKEITEDDKKQFQFTLAQAMRTIAEHYKNESYEKFNNYELETDDRSVFAIKVDFISFMESLGKRFLSDTSTIEGINHYLNKPILNLDIDSITENENIRLVRHKGERWMTSGVISAYLTNDPVFEEIVARYRRLFFPEHLQVRLNKLIEYLGVKY